MSTERFSIKQKQSFTMSETLLFLYDIELIIEVISVADYNDPRLKNISYKIKKVRKERHMTQSELADKVGISLSYLSKIEAVNCNKSFSLHVLFDIADALGVDIKDFF